MHEYCSLVSMMCRAKDPDQPEFHQAVDEVVESLSLVLERHPHYCSAKILERMVEPERVVMFRVPWMDDEGDDRGEPRVPDPDEQRHRPVQGWPALPSLRQPGHPQVPRLRAGVQELAHHAAHGRSQRRL